MRQYSISSDSLPYAARRFLAARPDADSFADVSLLMERLDDGEQGAPHARSTSTGRPLGKGRDKNVVANIAFRLAGLALIGVSVAAIRWMFELVHADAHHVATALDYLLALIGFAGASVGSILLCLGTHVFDEIEVSERWRRRP